MPLRIGLIGLGEAGTGLHLPALVGLPVVMSGACDLDETRRRRAAERWRIPVFDTVERLLTETDPDVVIVATPPDSHADLCLQALERRAHVVCEKPFVCSLEEADQVLGAAVAACRQVAVNHEFRQMPIFRTLVEHVKEPSAGPLQFVQVWQNVDLPQASEGGWRGEMARRTLFEAGVHLVDLVIALFGEMPRSVYAAMCAGAEGYAGDAVVVATFQFPDGRLAQLTQNRACRGEPQYFEVRADTTCSSFRASFGGRARLSAGLFKSGRPHLRVEYGAAGVVWREDGARRTCLARNPRNPNVVATREVLREALEAFERNVPPRPDGAHARDILEVVAGCYLSAQTGERVTLDGLWKDRLRRLRLGSVPQGSHE
jgi:predicted dehydrogenase